MSSPLAVLVVGSAPATPALLEALRGAGLDPRPCAPDEVLSLLSSSVADAVVASAIPGWRLLLSRVVASGARAVLHVPEGPAPRTLPGGIVAVTRAEQIARALQEAAAPRPPRPRWPRPSSSGSPRRSGSRPRSRPCTCSARPEEIAWEAVRRVRGLVPADRVICWRIGDDATLTLGAADPAAPRAADVDAHRRAARRRLRRRRGAGQPRRG